jgi:hypothetical protein
MPETSSSPSLTLRARLARAPRLAAIGVVLVLGMLGLLYWNEDRAVGAHRAFDEGAASVVHVLPDRVDTANEGKVVHLTGQIITEEVLRDDVLGASAKALRLERHVEMYLWDETSRSDNGKTEYTYTKRWSPRPIDSGGFKEADAHKNPSLFPYPEQSLFAQAPRLGAFSLPKEALSSLTTFEALPVTPEMLASAPADARAKLKPSNGALFMGQNPDAPQVGDLRISFQVVRPAVASVIGRQQGQAIAAAQLSADRQLLLVSAGEVDERTMFGRAPAEASPWFLYLRVLGAALLSIGVLLLFQVLSVQRDLGKMHGVRVFLQRLLCATFLGVALGAVAACLPWFGYRVWVGTGIAAGALVSWALAMVFLRVRKA